MERTMKAAVMTGIGTIEMQTRPMPVPKDNEVLVRIRHVGICGSDLHYYEHGRIGGYVVNGPMILGHESAGEVAGFGSAVTGFSLGDRVAIEPGYTCGVCEFCRSGRYNLCPDVVFMATPPYDGAFCEYVAYPAQVMFKLPDNVDTLSGALVEPLSVGFHAAAQGSATVGETAAVLGAGCIGLCTMMALRARGVAQVYMTDVLDKRLSMAMEMGADAAWDPTEADVVALINAQTGGRGVDMVLETAGSKAATQQTVDLVARGGRIVLVGMAPDATLPFDFGTLMGKEASIHTVFRYRNLYPVAIRAIASGQVDVAQIVTDIFPFEKTADAMRHASENKKDLIKTVIAFED
jgi:L-iditol 2-dehydrogenase